jgi:hypothetical protein
MTATSTRRAMLAGAAAIPALSLPAFAEANPDAELVALGEELKRALAAWLAYNETGPGKKYQDRYERLKPPEPEVPAYPQMSDELKRLFPDDITTGQLEAVKKIAPDHPIVVFYDNYEMHPAWKAYGEECSRLQKECGGEAIDDEDEKLSDKYFELYRLILKTPARSVAGLLVKIEAAQTLDGDRDCDGSVVDRSWLSMRRDIRAMATLAMVGTTRA